MSAKWILTDWSADWPIWIGMTCTMQWWCHMLEILFNECPTLFQPTYCYFKTMPAAWPSSLLLPPFSHPFSLTIYTHLEYTTHIITVLTLSPLTRSNKCPSYFSNLRFASKGKEAIKEAVLDCCEQSWCFHGGRGGGACKDRSIAHTNCSLPVIWKSEREWGKKLLHSVTEKHTHKKKNGCKWRKRRV